MSNLVFSNFFLASSERSNGKEGFLSLEAGVPY